MAVPDCEVARLDRTGGLVDAMNLVGGAGVPEPLNPFLRLGQRSHVRHAGHVFGGIQGDHVGVAFRRWG